MTGGSQLGVVVVSGSGSGIGSALAAGAAARGAEVFGLDPRPARNGDPVRRFDVDVTDAGAVGEALDAIVAEAGGIDVLFSNAGVRSTPAPFLEIAVGDWRRDVEVNLTGAFVLGQAAARRMVGRGGVIVNTVSQLAFSVVPGNAAYLASKAGLAHLTSAMSRELAPQGVRVFGVAPGIVSTEMTEELMRRPEWTAERLARIPAGRFAAPEEIAELMLDLAGPSADYLHGSVVVADGGYLTGC